MKALSLAGDLIATGGADGVARLLTSGAHLGSSEAHTDIINSVAAEPSGRVVSGSRDRTVRLFDSAIGRSYEVGRHDHWVMSVAWSDDGSRIASASEDGTVGLWDPEGASVKRIDLGRPANSVDWRGDVIAVAGGDRTLHLFDSDGSPRRSIPGATQLLWGVALAPDATTAAWTGRDRHLRIAPVAAGEPTVVAAHDAQVWSVAWNEAGDRIATASADGTVAIWTPKGEPVERIVIGSWIRKAVMRGTEILLATETGSLLILSTDGLPAARPDSIRIPQIPETCAHWDPRVTDPGPRPRCEECASPDESRLCVTCGHIGCCESQLAHATKHWLDTGHPNTVPVAGPFPWRWCYPDDMYVKDARQPNVT